MFKVCLLCNTLISVQFEKTKNLIIGLTHHLDKTEEVYNLFLKEHKKRNG